MKIIRLVIALSLSALCVSSAFAVVNYHYEVDVYNSSSTTPEEIRGKYDADFKKIMMTFVKDYVSPSDQAIKEVNAAFSRIKNGIKADTGLYDVEIGNVYYPGTNNMYFTIDPIESDKKIQYNQVPNQSVPDPNHLVHHWQAYSRKGMHIMLETGNPKMYQLCPAHHCVFGFDHPMLKKYEPMFMTLVEPNKDTLVQMMRIDKDAEKRAAAIFLLAHIKNGEEFIKLISPSINDPDEGVRNNAMRAIGMALTKIKVDDFPVENIVEMLSRPSVTDRNKALMVVCQLIQDKKYADYVRLHAGKALMAALKLKQPNNHKSAYIILRMLSHKKYADRDYVSWQRWIDAQH